MSRVLSSGCLPDSDESSLQHNLELMTCPTRKGSATSPPITKALLTAGKQSHGFECEPIEGLPEENSSGEIKGNTAQNFISAQRQQIERPRGGIAEVDDDFVGITMAGSISDTMPLSGKRSLTVRKITIIQDEWSKGSSVYNGSKSAGIITLDKAK